MAERVREARTDPGAARRRGLLASSPRAWRILRILARAGFIGALRRGKPWPGPEKVKLALEELGVVFLKFGQVLALRRDLLPPDYIEALETLHDRLPPVDFDIVRRTVEQSFGTPLEARFARFDETPMASATIAQVHEAALSDGSEVVVKVRRPGLMDLIADDTAILARLAAAGEALDARLRAMDLIGMVREFRASLYRETDMVLEGQTIRRFRDPLSAIEGLWIPDVVKEYTTAEVLTMEHSPGVRIDRYAETHPEERTELAGRMATLVLHQVFETGLFHADPHPGNVFVLPDGRLCLHDFGMIGELDRPTIEGLTDVMQAFVDGDARGLTDAYMALGWLGEDIDRGALERDLGALIRGVRERPLEEVSIGQAIEALLRTGTKHKVSNPGVLLLLARAFLIAEAVIRQLDPQVSVARLFSAELERITIRRYSAERLRARTRQTVRGLERLGRDLPARLERILARLEAGNLGRVQAPSVEAAGLRASRDLERLTGALVSAGFLVAGALLVGIGGWHRLAGDLLILLGLVGALATAVGALFGSRK